MTRPGLGLMFRARVGQDHPRAALTDAEVDLMRHMHEVEKIGYRQLAKMFEIGKTTVRDICNYRTRCSTPEYAPARR